MASIEEAVGGATPDGLYAADTGGLGDHAAQGQTTVGEGAPAAPGATTITSGADAKDKTPGQGTEDGFSKPDASHASNKTASGGF